MSGVFVRHTLVPKHMAQVSIASGASDLDPMVVGVGKLSDCTREGVIEAGPPGAGVEFGVRGEEGGRATGAGVGAILFVLQELARERRLSAAACHHMFCFGR